MLDLPPDACHRRVVDLPDLNAPYVERDLPGTRAERFTTILSRALETVILMHRRSLRRRYRKRLRNNAS